MGFNLLLVPIQYKLEIYNVVDDLLRPLSVYCVALEVLELI